MSKCRRETAGDVENKEHVDGWKLEDQGACSFCVGS